MKPTKKPARKSVTIQPCEVVDRTREISERLQLTPTEIARTALQVGLPADPGWNATAKRQWEEAAMIAKRKLAVIG